jgi:hypothetical protein
VARNSKKTGSPSPTLVLQITEQELATAQRSRSGGCLVADAIKRTYPHFSKVDVDMATVRVSDPARGERYVYLTPPSVMNMLLAFDQGWPLDLENPLRIRRAVQIVPITRAKTGPSSIAAVQERRRARIAELVAKVDAGEELTRAEKSQLTNLRKNEAAAPPPERPSTKGAPEVIDGGTAASRERPTIRGGKSRIKSPANPNLLAGRNRHFGAKLSDPGLAFREAVAQAVADQQKIAAES